MADSCSDKIDKALAKYNEACNSTISQLKEMQKKALGILLSGKDCICSVPTGYGKSLIYEMLPFVEEDVVVIVIVPLNAIVKQQIDKLGMKAISVCTDDKDTSKLNSLKYNFMFCHPEQALTDTDLNSLFCSTKFEEKKKYLVVDEAHCILDWGTDFRPEFRNLYQLRSMFKCHVLALSATITKYGAVKIAESLHMQHYEIVNSSPAKDNILLMVKERPSGTTKGNSANTPYDYIFVPILEKLKDELQCFKITIIFCKSLNWIGYGYEVAKRILQEDFYAGTACPENARVVMFHSSMERQQGQLKEMILYQLQKPASICTVRLIFSSVALGMGADLQHVSRIIHAGPPTSLETYVQEIGRAGRSGAVAEAVLFYNKADLGVPSVKKEMKEYCRNNEICRRSSINSHFGFRTTDRPAICCDICSRDLGLEFDFDKVEISSDHTYMFQKSKTKGKTKERLPKYVHVPCDHTYTPGPYTPIKQKKQTKRKHNQLTPSGKTPTSKRSVPQTGFVSMATTRLRWSAREKQVLMNWVQTHDRVKESDNEYWMSCSHHINENFPESRRTGDSCRKAYNRQTIMPTKASFDTCDSLGIELDEDMVPFTRSVAVQTDLSFMDSTGTTMSSSAKHTEGEWIFMEPHKEMKEDASKAAHTLHSVAIRRMRQYADLKPCERAKLIESLCHGSSRRLAREILSSALGNDIRCLLVKDIELEAKDCATRRSVLHPKQYQNLKDFNWDEIIEELTEKQTFLAEVLLAVILPEVKIGSLPYTESAVPVLGSLYGIMMKQRFHELSRIQRVVSVILANEQTAQKVYDRLQPIGITLSHTGMLDTMATISGSFNEELTASIKDGKRFRIVGDNINFSIGVSHERKSEKKSGHMEHWFGSAAIIQNVSFDDRPDITPQCNLLQLPAESFIMNEFDWHLIGRDYKILMLRILTDFFPWLKFVKALTDQEICGDMPLEMRNKNKVIPLQIMHRNEQKYADVVDILDYYQLLSETAYQSCCKETPHVQVGGDQLTRERFYGAKRLRAAAFTASERLANLSPITFELFHLQMTILATFYDNLYSKDTTEPLTLHAQKIRLSRNDADGNDVKNHYDSCKELAVSFVRAYVVEAACHHFDVPNTDEVPDWLPDYTSMSNEEIHDWALNLVEPIIDNMLSGSKDHLTGSADDGIGGDAIMNYGNTVLELGFLFLNLCDIIRNPSRIRLLCLMKYMMLVLKGHRNKSKYALEILRLLCQQFALLSEKKACESLYGLFVNTGKAIIPADLQMEYIVRLTKGHLKSMCSNKTDNSLIKRSSSFFGMDEISNNFDKQTCVVRRAQRHRQPGSYEDEKRVVEDLRRIRPFMDSLTREIPSMRKVLKKSH